MRRAKSDAPEREARVGVLARYRGCVADQRKNSPKRPSRRPASASARGRVGDRASRASSGARAASARPRGERGRGRAGARAVNAASASRGGGPPVNLWPRRIITGLGLLLIVALLLWGISSVVRAIASSLSGGQAAQSDSQSAQSGAVEASEYALSGDQVATADGLLTDGTTIDIEIQNSWSAEFIPRTLFYWAKIYAEGFKEGEAYTSLAKCIAINLVSQGFKLNNLVHSVYRILEKKSYQQLTDLLEIHFLNLLLASQVTMQQEPIGNQEKLINWLQFINTDDKEERAMIATTSPVLQILNEKIDVLSLTPKERKLYESRMKLKSDIATISEVQFNSGLERGLAEGEARGSRQKALETAKNLLHFGLSRENIAQATGLSPAEVEAL